MGVGVVLTYSRHAATTNNRSQNHFKMGPPTPETLISYLVVVVLVILSCEFTIVSATMPPSFDSVDAASTIVEELLGVVRDTGSSHSETADRMNHASHTSTDQPPPLLLPMLGHGAISTRISSQCWRTGIEIIRQTVTLSESASTFQSDSHTLQQHSHVTNAASFCSNLTEIQLKRLVLEITYCHMKDVDKAMYQSTSIQNMCTASSSTTTTTFKFMDSATVQMCLHHLTDIGYNTYTYFLPYVDMVCIRKTQELFNQYQYDTINTITTNYIRMTEQSTEQFRTNTEQVQHLLNMMTDIQEQLSNEIAHQFRSASVGFDNVFQNQAQVWHEHLTDMVERVYTRDTEHQDRLDDWMHYQSSMLLQQSREMEYQRQLIYRHEEIVNQLSVTIEETSKHVQPMLQLQSFITVAKYSYHGISFLFHFVAAFNILWILTRFQRCDAFRSYLFGIIWTEALVEVLLTMAIKNDFIVLSDHSFFVSGLRQGTFIVALAVYIFGVIMSMLLPARKQRQRQKWLDNEMTHQQQQQQDELEKYVLSKQNNLTTSFPQQVTRVCVADVDHTNQILTCRTIRNPIRDEVSPNTTQLYVTSVVPNDATTILPSSPQSNFPLYEPVQGPSINSPSKVDTSFLSTISTVGAIEAPKPLSSNVPSAVSTIVSSQQPSNFESRKRQAADQPLGDEPYHRKRVSVAIAEGGKEKL